MRLNSGHSLTYCTNVHRGESWSETFLNLKSHALSVRNQISKNKPFALGLRLGDLAARELESETNLNLFREWLEKENCYVRGINGFPFGPFHGQAVKENVFLPDWADPARLDYTQRLFKLLAALNPQGSSGTVSTLPLTLKTFNRTQDYIKAAQKNILDCVDFLSKLRDSSGVHLRLALEPEPLGHFENTPQTIDFFDQLREKESSRGMVDNFMGVCYDTCHFALQYEDAVQSIKKLNSSGAPILKYHLSSALKINPTNEALRQLAGMQEPTYLHQCIGRTQGGGLIYFKDIPEALVNPSLLQNLTELRIHFHLPLHSEPVNKDFSNTTDFLKKVIGTIKGSTSPACELEIETYTWEVLPPSLRSKNVTDQIVSEYRWVLSELAQQRIEPA